MTEQLHLPVLPLRDAVLFPGIAMPIGAGRPGTLKAIESALRAPEPLVLALSQRKNVDRVDPDGLYHVGTIARLGQVQRNLSGMQLVLHGERRGIAVRLEERSNGYLVATTLPASDEEPIDPQDPAFVGLFRETRERSIELAKRAGLPEELVSQVMGQATDPAKFADLVAAYLEQPTAERQRLLEIFAVEERLRQVLLLVQRQLDVIDAQEEIQSKVREELGDRQREAILREQMRAIQKELGEGDDGKETDELAERLEQLELPEAARKEVDRELGRLRRIGRESMETQVIRTYLETIAELPWSERSEEKLDIQAAEAILEEDHYGLQDVKDRVLEFLAVRQLRLARETAAEEARESEEGAPAGEGAAPADGEPPLPEADAAVSASGDELPEPIEKTEPAEKEEKAKPKRAKGPILLFVGPPGVGKTSIAKSIARATGREYVRISLGGARDEADIRGHRRTYVGAMPGRILQGMKQVGTKNPVFLLDEIDKLGVSFQGDPAAALLEVLDPAQNDSFVDHYLGVPFDLSEVLFVATANFPQNIPGPLLDRMEMVEFSGYTEAEKREIAKRFLLPRQVDENGLAPEQLALDDEALATVINGYTREAGVRQLERELGKLARKVARRLASGESERVEVSPEAVRELLGRPRVHPERAARADQVGVATGMFYTPVGGDILFVEASAMKGKGELVLTGQLGDVMKESARAAWSYARAHAVALGIDPNAFEQELHIHVPAGAVPKDGPSAGVTMATAVVSVLSDRPVRHDLAMTGEITLSGRVLPIGGVKEKVLGAVRAGIREILLPKENEADLEDLPAEVREAIVTHPVEDLGEVLARALRGASYREGRLLFSSGDGDEGRDRPLRH
ncbi:MAG: endopeptidase La [Acidobacteria bacterium]|nr:endopeptidase La [Acidobacteriota bacterium]MCB9378141.1 endopeptidase La [Holophagales bacterium]